MKFLKRLMSPKKSNEEIQLEWSKILKKISGSLINDELEYPIILLDHVSWKFEVFHSSSELIGASIEGHWGLNNFITTETDELEIIIDSTGKIFEFFHEHYHKETKNGFSYPSKFKGTETLNNLKNKIIEGSNSFVSNVCPERENEISAKLVELNKLNSIQEVITYVSKYMQF